MFAPGRRGRGSTNCGVGGWCHHHTNNYARDISGPTGPIGLEPLPCGELARSPRFLVGRGSSRLGNWPTSRSFFAVAVHVGPAGGRPKPGVSSTCHRHHRPP